MWTGAISFGMVTVPVKLYSALDRKAVRFHQLSAKSGVRITQKRIDPSSGEEVPYEEVVKGYEITPERYVKIEPGELEALAPKKSRAIEIEEFVELAQIDPVYYDHPYYLAPGPGGAKPYRLLWQAMSEAGKVAIARVVIRSKESLVAIRPIGDALEMATMIFADEVLPSERLEEIAVQPAPEEVTAPAPDLMSALKASLDAVRAREDAPAKDGKRPPARKAAAKKAASKPRAKKPSPARR